MAFFKLFIVVGFRKRKYQPNKIISKTSN